MRVPKNNPKCWKALQVMCTSVLFKAMMNSTDFYKGVFLHVVPVRVTVSSEHIQFQKLFSNRSNINNKYS